LESIGQGLPGIPSLESLTIKFPTEIIVSPWHEDWIEEELGVIDNGMESLGQGLKTLSSLKTLDLYLQW